MKSFIFFAALSVCYLVQGTSFPDPEIITLCDATSPKWGCDPTKWLKGSRLNCTEVGQQMAWASKPVKSACYKLFAGSEAKPVSTYTPGGQLLTLQLRVDCYRMLFRGILLYAVDENEKKVGDWQISGGDDAQYSTPFAKGSPCAGSLMHATAENKPYLTSMYFQTPAKGTGKITFRCLIKFGNANDGAFYHLEKDVILYEAPVIEEAVVYKMGALGKSCQETCNTAGYNCDSVSLSKRDDFSREITERTACNLPLLSGCGKDAGSYTPTDQSCYYPGTDCTQTNRTAVSATCTTKSTGVQRFCACSGTFAGSSDSADTPNDEIENSSSSSLHGITALLGFAMFFFTPRFASVFFALWCLTSVSAHNWVGTQSRSPNANTFSPFVPATSDLPHVQVGKGQLFNIEWMTAHGGFVYFSVVHSKYESHFKSVNSKLLEDYILNAPASGTFNATNTKYQRFHRQNGNSTNLTPNSGIVRENYFLKVLQPGDQFYFPRDPNLVGKSNQNQNLAQFRPESLVDDRVVSYKSDKYPWLEAVHKYKLTTSQTKGPDTANFFIPGFAGFGRYIVQYYWGSYKDAIDVDYVDRQVDQIYGVKSTQARWKRIDHCLFSNPQKVFKFSEIVTDPSSCLRTCGLLGACGGVNVVPLKVPETAYKFKQPEGVTWFRPDIPGSDILIPWNTTAFTNKAADVKEIFKNPTSDKFICYTVDPQYPSDTESEYLLSKDPSDPIFYSTCYYPYKGNVFEGYNTSLTPAIDVRDDWRFAEKCLSCESKSYNNYDNVIPHWEIADTCINCDREPTVAPRKAPIAHVIIEEKARCDGLEGFWRKNTQHHTCPSNNTCVINVFPLGRDRGDSITLDECKLVVARNKNCSDVYFWEAGTYYDTVKSCYCYAKESCCGTCSRISDDKFTVYETTPKADPTCANGVLSTDKKSCCSAGCSACGDTTGTVVSQGFCCSTCIKERPCSQFSAPCTL